MASTLNTPKLPVAALIVVALVFIIGAALITTLLFTQTPHYSDNPSDWTSERAGGQTVDVSEMTDGTSRYEDTYQRIPITGDEIAGLVTYGVYRGDPFTGTLYDETSAPLMRTSPQLVNTRDGVPEAFGLAQLDSPYDELVDANGAPRPRVTALYFYLDEDFKQLHPQGINIIWGSDVTQPGTLHLRPFNFSTSTNGLYYDHVTTDIDWILQTQGVRNGRAFVGPLTIDDVITDNFNTTFIVLI